MKNRYEDLVTSVEELRELVGTPNEAVVKKSIAQIDEHIRHYLSKSPLFFLSTAGREGRCDVSPRGDAPGSVHILDDQRLVYAERPGNRRIDSLLNILSNPQVGMLFIIPGQEEVLRINGKAWITRNEELLRPLEWKGTPPKLGVIVEVEEAFVHCPRALKQAGIWDLESWPPAEERPSIQEMFKAHLQINGLTLK
ncbi:MSMEG_1061 family FMN-dependent PPOX-type flavoprotein [Paenibacillus sp. TAB 01]|uniref:MSMEG_1061 family FMN-dependent PPOX-type flavoprotein n=1 Tax=Paenibacillus sp. TAB 01 TaxID=3368988 RepID=UPI003752B57C